MELSEILILRSYSNHLSEVCFQNEARVVTFSGNDQKKRDILTIFTNHLLPILLSFQITSIHVLRLEVKVLL